MEQNLQLLNNLGDSAKEASYELANLTTSQRNNLLVTIADNIENNSQSILDANQKDIENYSGPEVMVDRLLLTEERIKNIVQSVKELVKLNDPIGDVINTIERPNGLNIKQVRVPFGVIGIIYESRPNVTIDAATMCLKTGNAVILRGGKEAIFTNIVLVQILQDSLSYCGYSKDCVQLVRDTNRESAINFMQLQTLDVLIPRGGKGLIDSVKENAKVPIIETGVGNCHIYIDKYADLKMAEKIIINAKTSRPSVCNSIEKLLIDSSISEDFLPIITKSLKENNVEIVTEPNENDWYEEYLDYKIAIKIVDGVDHAIEHINKYSSHHSESIITNNQNNADKFLKLVDSACVYHNVSTRFTDGAEFGFGAEIGISTQKLHARGPLGLKELTSTKYIIEGNGQIRE